jgi:FlaA1/EpsC-like NDP-sugar epimerase
MKERIKPILREIFRITALKRRAFFVSVDMILIAGSLYASFLLRFDGTIPNEFLRNFRYYIPLVLIVKLSSLFSFGMYNISWRFFGLKELTSLFGAVSLSSLGMAIFLFFFKTYAPFQGFPRSVLLLDYIFTLGFIGILRISKRAAKEYLNKAGRLSRGKMKILIIGAGNAGEQIGREMLNSKKSKYFPIGFIDDNPAKRGLSIHGIKVLGTRKEIPRLLKDNHIDEVLVAIPSASSKDIRQIVEIIRNSEEAKKIKILPGIMDLVDGNITLSNIQEIQVEDLLGREPVEIDYSAIRGFINGKCTLITGAGGSIGGELSRTLLQFEPKKLILLDIDETELYYLMNRIKSVTIETIPVIGDIRDRIKMEAVFERYRPEVIFHAAAYKHVPILEYYPEEAIKTNIIGTRLLGELAIKYNVERFVNISTDKAINPTSVMGATKRICEEMLKALNGKNGTKFISVRFGNVVGSRGSVIPVFKEQIRKGGPVTVTHPEMKRYFMVTSEAVLIVLEAAATGQGGEAYVLDMGEPVKIVDLAREMIKLSGHEPDVDIAIVYTGLRPGEKLFEEILGAEEGSEATAHAKIYRIRDSQPRDEKALWVAVDKLNELCAASCRREKIINHLREIVPTYKPNDPAISVLPW